MHSRRVYWSLALAVLLGACADLNGQPEDTEDISVASQGVALRAPYQQFSLHTGTALPETDATFAFAVASNRDLFAIKKSGTGT
jgi:hypothetical protein